ncbi:fatty acid synthase S-acetyltransferase [Hypoxylon cercidicola]|nr:fatty acid synthase S-acetyltransferase [Hypoxylon cercidicola]
MEPIAIVGLSFKLPQDALDEDSFWQILETRRNLMTDWPENRLTINSYYDGGSGKKNTLPGRGGHFLKEDIAGFDASFFSIMAGEANAMDPQQRWALEIAYRAFENAGMSLEDLKGSKTAVFASTISDDYSKLIVKDSETMPQMGATGVAPSILPGRISWFFDLHGPSVHLDTACSGSLVGLDLACQSLRNQDSSSALILASSMQLTPETSILLANMGFLSPDSLCYSFDHRANGYARGEGVIALVVKRLSTAIKDGNMIRAVVRSTGTNSDGRTFGLTRTSAESQEQLIRDVYQKAGLGFESTHFVEAHGTGTSTGDPIEMNAIGRVFGAYHSTENPLYVGSVKANIGHLEGGSGLAGVIKSVLSLERGIIPPNALFEQINPDIDVNLYHIVVPTETIAWPTECPRRISVNSFGIGGTNAHAIIDDACSYLHSQGLGGHHHCAKRPLSIAYSNWIANMHLGSSERLRNAHTGKKTCGSPYDEACNGFHGKSTDSDTVANCTDATVSSSGSARLLIWSAADEQAVHRMIQSYQEYYDSFRASDPFWIEQLAYTLATRRSHMKWRTYAIVNHESEMPLKQELQVLKPTRALPDAGLAFVFTGQGAEYAGMGKGLLRYPTFAQTMHDLDKIYAELGSKWSIIDELHSSAHHHTPEYSQPMCTALQIALVDLLRTFQLLPQAVIGHSSGEIAAAYAIGALSKHSACRVAYYRGRLAGRIRASKSTPGAMMSVNLSEGEVHDLLATMKLSTNGMESVNIGCFNSPTNCTITGEESILDVIKLKLDADGIFARKLNTGVAYHSPAMEKIASEYKNNLSSLSSDAQTAGVMISTVTGRLVSPQLLSTAEYWVENLTSPVQFVDALIGLSNLTLSQHPGLESITDIVEIGPHAALRRPTLDTISHAFASQKDRKYRYHTALEKSKCAFRAILEMAGKLFCRGHQVRIPTVNEQRHQTLPFLTDCPGYPFDHSRKFWAESRMSIDSRLRRESPRFLLGKRLNDWNPLEPRWRNILTLDYIPELGDHIVNNVVVMPATGMLVMAMQAIQQHVSARYQLRSFYIKRAEFISPIMIDSNVGETETMLHLRPSRNIHGKDSGWSEVKIYALYDGHWMECFEATIQSLYKEDPNDVDKDQEQRLENERLRNHFHTTSESCTRNVESRRFYAFVKESVGINFGQSFQLLEDIKWDGHDTSIASISNASNRMHTAGGIVHPATLDAAIHLVFAQTSRGLSRWGPTMVPRSLTNTWISAHGWEVSSVKVSSVAKCRLKPVEMEVNVSVMGEDGMSLCTIEKLSLTPISGNSTGGPQERMKLYGIEWRPQLSLLTKQQLRISCQAAVSMRTEPGFIKSIGSFDAVLVASAQRAIRDLTDEDLNNVPEHIRKHVASVRHYFPGNSPLSIDNESIECIMRQFETTNTRLRLLPTIARNMKALITGHMDPLETLFQNNMAEELYASVFDDMCDARFREFLSLVSHEQPGLRVLEVGAGTGALTSHILSTFQNFEKLDGSTHLLEYAYTDISPAFFEEARVKFQPFAAKMLFKRLDLELDALSQGFEPGSYDMIVAGSVLHATSHLTATLHNIRQLLKPGGYLLLSEPVAPQHPCISIPWGLLPGWWLSTEEWRAHSPIITDTQWEGLLQQTGFSGNDLVLRDFDDDARHMYSIIIAKAVNFQCEQDVPSPTRRLVIIVDGTSKTQIAVAEGLLGIWEGKIVSLDTAANVDWAECDISVSLLELGSPVVTQISERDFYNLKSVLQRSKELLWVTCPNSEGAVHGAIIGFLRVIRTEATEKHIVTLAIESTQQKQPITRTDCIKYVRQVLEASFCSSPSPEVEYIARDGTLYSGRLRRELNMDDKVQSLLSPSLRDEEWLPGRAVALDVEVPGILDTIQFVDDSDYCQAELAPGYVEIEAKAWPVSFRDIFILLGRLKDESPGFECAGVVTRVGSACGDFQPGDRVVIACPGCFRTYPRSHVSTTVRIPSMLSFEEAVSAINPAMTAFQSLIKLARLQPGEKVLIHSGAGGTGQMALWIAKWVGAEIFVTVGSSDKKKLLMEKFNIPATHIFYSRNTSFSQGDGLRASWECIAPYGRFVEIGKTDINSNASLPMGSFSRNTSFFAVDLHGIALSKPQLTRELFLGVMDLFQQGVMQNPFPLHMYTISEIEKAFRYMQSGKNTGRIVVTAERSNVVPKLLYELPGWKFNPDASYVVAGGLGGLGRSILAWMARRGAKNIIVLSRSGTSSSAAALDIVTRLRSQGVNVEAPRCDVSTFSALSDVLTNCAKTMPRIKGCINAAMVLQDAVFDNMTHAQWDLAIRTKTSSSWNLHELLPRDLDFFVLLSSLAGIYGSSSQSNYAAGCTYQDALARYRVNHGEKAVCLDLGWMRHIGIIAEKEKYRIVRENSNDMYPIEEDEFLALLDIYCDPSAPLLIADKAQLLVGARTPEDFAIQHDHMLPAQLMRPLFAGFQKSTDTTNLLLVDKAAEDSASLFRHAATLSDRSNVVVEGLAAKLARSLYTSLEDIDATKSLSDYGVDSLMAVELRNWIANDFNANVAVFDIMGGTTLLEIGCLVSERSEIKGCK